MAYRVALPNFSKGEIAPALYGRIDTAQYAAGLRKCRNFIVQKYGGVTFRPGTRLVGKVDDPTKPTRLAAFQFSIDQAYVLLLQQGSMRPMASGGFVVEQDTRITAATKSNHCQLTIPFHGLSANDRLYLTGVSGMVELNGRFVTVLSVLDESNITVDLDSRTFGTFTGSSGTLNASPPPAPPVDPVVPPPVQPDPGPSTGGGGGNYNCVAARTLIRTPNGEVMASDLKVGDLVRTRHEAELRRSRWGNYRIEAIRFVDEPTLVVTIDGKRLIATPEHRLFVEGEWRTMRELGGVSAGVVTVAKISVEGARTYVSNGLLSHNLKPQEVER